MVKKLPTKNEDQVTQVVLGYARQIWLAGLGAFARAETEGGKLFSHLVKEGEKFETHTKKITNERFEEALGALRGSASGTWDKMEGAFEERLASVLNRLGVPTKKDIEELSKQVDALNASIKVLNKP